MNYSNRYQSFASSHTWPWPWAFSTLSRKGCSLILISTHLGGACDLLWPGNNYASFESKVCGFFFLKLTLETTMWLRPYCSVWWMRNSQATTEMVHDFFLTAGSWGSLTKVRSSPQLNPFKLAKEIAVSFPFYYFFYFLILYLHHPPFPYSFQTLPYSRLLSLLNSVLFFINWY